MQWVDLYRQGLDKQIAGLDSHLQGVVKLQQQEFLQGHKVLLEQTEQQFRKLINQVNEKVKI